MGTALSKTDPSVLEVLQVAELIDHSALATEDAACERDHTVVERYRRKSTFGSSGRYELVKVRGDKAYRDLIKQCVEKAELWEDPDFPACDESIGPLLCQQLQVETNCKWKRPKEINANAVYVLGEMNLLNVYQGFLKDHWLLASLAAVGQYRNILDSIVPEQQDIQQSDYAGIFRACFWQNGRWIQVVVDDRLPVNKDGRLIFMRPGDNMRFWPALVEKAYSKFKMSYENMETVNAMEIMEDLTGGFCEQILLQNLITPNQLEMLLERFSKQFCLVTCGPVNLLPEWKLNGLEFNHAYNITGVLRFTNGGQHFCLARLRNSYGGGRRWDGSWAEGSKEWKSICKSKRKLFRAQTQNNGEFLMSTATCEAYFKALYVCHLTSGPVFHLKHGPTALALRESIKYGEWKGQSAGGSREDLISYAKNPQIFFQVFLPHKENASDRSEVYIALMQQTAPTARLEIGFHLYATNNLPSTYHNAQFFKKHRPVKEVAYSDSREFYDKFNLKEGIYMMVPSARQSNAEAKFIVRIYNFIDFT